MERGYYADYDDFVNEKVANNPVGFGINEQEPVDYYSRINMITGLEKLVQGMKDIISTPYGTRFMRPDYGSKLHEALHEQNDYVCQDLAEYFVRDAITKFEPRVIVDQVMATIDSVDRKVLHIRVEFHMKNSNDADSFVYSTNREFPEMG